MSRRTPLLLLALAACSLRPHEFTATDAANSGTTEPASTSDAAITAAPATGEPTGTSATTTTGEPAPATTTTGVGTSDSTTSNFITPLDGGPPGSECDSYAQDCPEGQKCVPYSGDGDLSWETLGCFDVVPRPDGEGEPCEVFESAVSGKDSCAEGLMCWDVDLDTGIGTCLALCGGSVEEPTCPDPNTFCSVGRLLSLCFPYCDPLAQDCEGGDLCVPNQSNPGGWLCVLDASGEEGQVFDTCGYLNDCDAGLYCTPPEYGAECEQNGTGCCLPYCDTSLPNTCPGEGQVCIPWYEDGQALPGYENVGLCGVPQA
ncbi:hypothetical protein [Nannocystis sp. SCPEA4]|uniref:hypothetical protein n=1 Tax=Nannocystis sp. SCPEA4 TaxID=2996787 RepID=UPI002270AF59|nr:hypothetical protein [Nannocystis sp. SCPEA4]MCY1062351.1 hypothetical protein [Nannocystis sp. SCPEA4]